MTPRVQARPCPCPCRGPPPPAVDRPLPHNSWLKVPPLAVPQLCSCASSGRALRLWAARHSQEEIVPLRSQPLPRLLEPAASKAAHFTAFDLTLTAQEVDPDTVLIPYVEQIVPAVLLEQVSSRG